ncbi:MAG: hypothetical protein M1820_005158 [Bogoriella megaspora]|nr:MAG: hypothetical protein M1820_005158 [Bogoriella megaspora]
MSSEQRYYSYEQYVQEDLPSFDLFGEFSTASITNPSACSLQEDDSTIPQLGEQTLCNDACISHDCQDFGMMSDTAEHFTSVDVAATSQGPGRTPFDPTEFSIPHDPSQTANNVAVDSRMAGPQAAQPSSRNIRGASPIDLAMASNDVAHSTDLPASRLEPIDRALRAQGTTEWHGPQKCHFSNCPSKATFRSPSQLKIHVQNVHITPLLCTYPGCPYKKPFGKLCDLRRHIVTKHDTEGGYQCLDADCQEVFPRKDKMMKHAFEKHKLFKCSRNHCTAIVSAAQMELHMSTAHGRYECAIGSCEYGPDSLFTKENLTSHLRTCHQFRRDRRYDLPVPIIGDDGVLRNPLGASDRHCPSCLAMKQDEH